MGAMPKCVDLNDRGFLVDGENNPVRMIDEVSKLRLKCVVLSNEGAPLGHILDRVNSLIKPAKPVDGILWGTLVDVEQGLTNTCVNFVRDVYGVRLH